MAQVSQEIIDMLSVDQLTTKIKTIIDAIEKQKLIDGASYSLEGIEYAK
jgi:hypothetical protein